eukprot:UN03679
MFEEIQGWLANVLTDSLLEGTRSAVVQFGHEFKLDYNLEDFNSRDERIEYIQNVMEPLGGATYTKDALEFAVENVYPQYRLDRDLVSILVTDGQPSRDRSPCSGTPEANAIVSNFTEPAT